MKHDLQRGTTEVHDYGAGCMTTEPVFVAKAGAQSEDEGWILSSVYDSASTRSDIVILDAQDFAGDPVATIRLPTRIPFTFHGGWAPDRRRVKFHELTAPLISSNKNVNAKEKNKHEKENFVYGIQCESHRPAQS